MIGFRWFPSEHKLKKRLSTHQPRAFPKVAGSWLVKLHTGRLDEKRATTQTGVSSRMIWKGDRKAHFGGHLRDLLGSTMNRLGSRGKPGLPTKPRLLLIESGGGVSRRRQGVSRFRTGKDSLTGFVSHLCPTFFCI